MLGPGRGGLDMFTDLQIVIMYKDDLIQYASPRKGVGLIFLQIVIIYTVDLIHYRLGPGRGD